MNIVLSITILSFRLFGSVTNWLYKPTQQDLRFHHFVETGILYDDKSRNVMVI